MPYARNFFALEWIANPKKQCFFLFLSFKVPHINSSAVLFKQPLLIKYILAPWPQGIRILYHRLPQSILKKKTTWTDCGNRIFFRRKKDASQKVLVFLKKELRSGNLTNNLTKTKLATDKKRTLEKKTSKIGARKWKIKKRSTSIDKKTKKNKRKN